MLHVKGEPIAELSLISSAGHELCSMIRLLQNLSSTNNRMKRPLAIALALVIALCSAVLFERVQSHCE
jgi:hypothetical protein